MRVNDESRETTVDGEDAPRIPRRHNPRQNAGRPHASGTRLAKIMRERGIKKHNVATVLRCSDPTVYNYLTRRYPIPALQLGALCDRLDMDPEQLVDDQGFLLLADAEEGG